MAIELFSNEFLHSYDRAVKNSKTALKEFTRTLTDAKTGIVVCVWLETKMGKVR